MGTFKGTPKAIYTHPDGISKIEIFQHDSYPFVQHKTTWFFSQSNVPGALKVNATCLDEAPYPIYETWSQKTEWVSEPNTKIQIYEPICFPVCSKQPGEPNPDTGCVWNNAKKRYEDSAKL